MIFPRQGIKLYRIICAETHFTRQGIELYRFKMAMRIVPSKIKQTEYHQFQQQNYATIFQFSPLF